MLYEAAAVPLDPDELSRAGAELALARRQHGVTVVRDVIACWRVHVDRALSEGEWNSPDVEPSSFTVDDLPRPDDPSASPIAILVCAGAGVMAYRLGVSADNSRRHAQALRWWRLAAATGHATAAFDLAIAARDRGDVDNALRWWGRAAANGHPESARIINVLTLAGLSIPDADQGHHLPPPHPTKPKETTDDRGSD